MSGSEDEKDNEKIVREIARLINSQELDSNRIIDAIHQVRVSQERFSWMVVFLTLINVGLVYMTYLFLAKFETVVIIGSVSVWLVAVALALFWFYKYLERAGKEEEKSRKTPILVK